MKTKFFSAENIEKVALIILLIIYLMLGGLIFEALESASELAIIQNQVNQYYLLGKRRKPSEFAEDYVPTAYVK